MTRKKRIFDMVMGIIVLLLLIPILLLIIAMMIVIDGRPVFYVSERMKTPIESFQLFKLRTMKPSMNDKGVSGGDKSDRITRTGHILRRFRLDELPQIWNILKGDISFVGPRPPLRQYVEKYPEIYNDVLKSRPGVTGLASVFFNRHEEWLLKNTSSIEETDEIYCRSCIPRKAKIDLIYQRNCRICTDIWIIIKTIIRNF